MAVYIAFGAAYESIAMQLAIRLKAKKTSTFLNAFKGINDKAKGLDNCKMFIPLGCDDLEQDSLFSTELTRALELDAIIFPVSVQTGYVPTGQFGRLLDGLYVVDLSTEAARKEQLPMVVASIEALLAARNVRSGGAARSAAGD